MSCNAFSLYPNHTVKSKLSAEVENRTFFGTQPSQRAGSLYA